MAAKSITCSPDAPWSQKRWVYPELRKLPLRCRVNPRVARTRGQPAQFHPMQQSVGARQAAIAIKLLFQDALGIDLRSLDLD